MEKKKKFEMPHTYIIIFFVILFAAVLTMFIPLGTYETREVTYMQGTEEKTRTVIDPDSFQYVLDENGDRVTKVAPLFGTEDFGGQGILNYVFEGLTVGDKNGTAVGMLIQEHTAISTAPRAVKARFREREIPAEYVFCIKTSDVRQAQRPAFFNKICQQYNTGSNDCKPY